MNCQWKKCPNEATHGLALNVPAVGCPIQEHDPIRIVIGLVCCEEHIHACKAADFLTADGRLQKLICIAARGRAAPDFNRAFLTGIPLDSDEWKTFNKVRGPK